MWEKTKKNWSQTNVRISFQLFKCVTVLTLFKLYMKTFSNCNLIPNKFNSSNFEKLLVCFSCVGRVTNYVILQVNKQYLAAKENLRRLVSKSFSSAFPAMSQAFLNLPFTLSI